QLALVELFPVGVRSSASGLGYNVAYALFGGTAPYIATWLVGNGHSSWPGFYLSTLCCLSVVAAALGIGNRVRSNSESVETVGSDISPQRAS
ncbi:hypothetical protein JK364_54040, partial [Streptomyces sp. 110]|nr:hypothetical protein [Streptomyces endocoffeicus]